MVDSLRRSAQARPAKQDVRILPSFPSLYSAAPSSVLAPFTQACSSQIQCCVCEKQQARFLPYMLKYLLIPGDLKRKIRNRESQAATMAMVSSALFFPLSIAHFIRPIRFVGNIMYRGTGGRTSPHCKKYRDFSAEHYILYPFSFPSLPETPENAPNAPPPSPLCQICRRKLILPHHHLLKASFRRN